MNTQQKKEGKQGKYQKQIKEQAVQETVVKK
jgi:hypothetical protein